MDMKALAAAAAKRAQKSGVAPPSPPKAKKKPVTAAVPQQNAASKNAAKNAAAAAIAAKLGGGPRGPPPPQAAPAPAASRPASSSGGASSSASLSPADEAIAQQYRKMMKLGLPEGAIRHKMSGDNVPNHIQDAVIAGGAAPPPTSSAPSRAAAAPPPPRQAPAPAAPAVKLNPADEQVAAQYRKMVKLGLPEGAVCHKMNGDGVPDHIQQAVLSGGGGAPAGAAASTASLPARKAAPPPPPPPPAAPKSAGTISSLSPADEKIATPYRKMVKMGLPPPAVRHKMNAVSFNVLLCSCRDRKRALYGA